MGEERKYDCWLYSVPGIGNRAMERLFTICSSCSSCSPCRPDAEAVFRAGESLWRQALTARQAEQMLLFTKHISPDGLWHRLMEDNIRFVMRGDAEYPARLRDIPDPPYALFVKGKLPAGDMLSVAVVGARDCSEYGRYVADGIGRALGACGVQIVSGMARGIDGISQNAALEAGGISFGVLGCGVDVCYPASNRSLYERLCVQGGILSAYPPGTEPRPQYFPLRNRIVSGLADVLIVVEAREKSGTLITVDMALEQGRDVYVVPGRVTDRLSDGCNRLIRQGAGVFLSPEDFLRELREGWQYGQCNGGRRSGPAMSEEISGRPAPPAPECLVQLAPECRAVYDVLELSPLSVEQIGERLTGEYSGSELLTALMRLCVEKLAVQKSPGHFCLNGDGRG